MTRNNFETRSAEIIAAYHSGTINYAEAAGALLAQGNNHAAIKSLLGKRPAGNVTPLHPAGTFPAEREAARTLLKAIVVAARNAHDLGEIAGDDVVIDLASNVSEALLTIVNALVDLDRLYAKQSKGEAA